MFGGYRTNILGGMGIKCSGGSTPRIGLTYSGGMTDGRARGEVLVSCYTFSETGMGAITPWTSRGHVNSEVIECTTRRVWGA